MRIRIENSTKFFDISLQLWNGHEWESDCFSYFEDCFPNDHIFDRAGDTVVAPEKDTAELIEWWENEVRNANTGDTDGEILGVLTDSEKANGYEWDLGVDEGDVELCSDRATVKALADRIRNSDTWDRDDLEELCFRAGLDAEWEHADGESFEAVVYAAAKILGVEI